MLRKALIVTAIGTKVAVLALLGQWLSSPVDSSDARYKADCPECMPDPNCFPGDSCADCG